MSFTPTTAQLELLADLEMARMPVALIANRLGVDLATFKAGTARLDAVRNFKYPPQSSAEPQSSDFHRYGGALVSSAAATAKAPPKSDEPKVERVTKQERLLTLLSQAEGASIEEMMQATDWQQHSVRGFLAGTVKKKLGFSLTTSKAAGDVRRCRIETRRGR